MSEPPEKPDQLLLALPSLVDAECRRRDISQRAAARELGLSASTVVRVIQGHGVDAHALLKILRWLGLTTDWLREPDSAHNAYRRGWNDCADRVRAVVDGEVEP